MPMNRRNILELIPVMMVLAISEFTVMTILPIFGIPDGPLTYLVDAVLLAALSAPFLHAWSKKMSSHTPRLITGDSGAHQMHTLEELERQAIIKALEAAHGDRSRAALMLGVSRATIYRKVKMLGLDDSVRA